MFEFATLRGKAKYEKKVSLGKSAHKKENIKDLIGQSAFDFISMFADLSLKETKVFNTASSFNITSINDDLVNVVNIKRINDIRFINKFFEAVNEKMPSGGIFISCAEIKGQRKKRILNKYPKIISYPYYVLDFIVKRIFPKWKPTKKLYFFLTRGNNRVISMPEVLGRLVSCGFKIVHYKDINNLMYFAARKENAPSYDSDPSYGLIFKMKRVGKDGKYIYVHKLRTMHPYAEYLQKYMYNTHNLEEGGKFKDDYRITHWGKIFRKLWIDELPMLYNWFKGDLKLVGLRPLSAHYLSLYDEEFAKRRIKYKPGLIPPYYVDLPKSIDEIVLSEKKYLDNYEKAPFKTDVKYFFQVGYNIFVKGARSK